MKNSESNKIYPNSPLVEVVFEIRFPAEPVVECRRDILYDFIRKDYNKVFVPKTMIGTANALEPYRFENDNRAEGVLLAINKFAYYSREYQGFKLFKESFLALLKRFKESYPGIKTINRTGFRYINLIPFTKDGGVIPLDKILNIEINVPELIPDKYSNLNIGFVSKTDKESITVRVESITAQDQSGESLLFDIDSFQDGDIEINNIVKHLEECHKTAHKVFENLITDDYRKYLEGNTL